VCSITKIKLRRGAFFHGTSSPLLKVGGKLLIRVNFREMEWKDGLTVEGLLQIIRKEKTYNIVFSGRATVIVNNEVIPPSEYSKKAIRDGDEIRIYPVIAGG